MIENLTRDEATLVTEIVEKMESADPELYRTYGPEARKRTLEDTAFHLQHLAGALAVNEPGVFRDYKAWLHEMLTARGIDVRHIDLCWRAIEDVLVARYGEEAYTAVRFLRA